LLAPLLFAAIQVLSPADGTTLRGGHFATLTWSAQQLPRGAEEWEAFLSVDGGRYYAVRLTPHLDLSVRSFQVLIPNVDSDDARMLIRTGDERNETIVEMPQHFRIRAEAQAVFRSRAVERRGESARPNEPGVVQWSVGDHVESSSTPASFHSRSRQSSHSTEIATTTVRVRHQRGGQAILPVRTDKIVCPPRRSADVLLQVSRMNV
jgi:hypothetical protein